MPTKKSPKKAKASSVKKNATPQQLQMAASVGPLLTIIGILAILCLLLGFYITLVQ